MRNFFSEDLAHAALQDDELTVDGSSNAARLRNEGTRGQKVPTAGARRLGSRGVPVCRSLRGWPLADQVTETNNIYFLQRAMTKDDKSTVILYDGHYLISKICWH